MKVGSVVVVKMVQIEYTLYSFQEPGVSCGFKFMHNRNYVEQIKIRRTALRIIEIMLHEYIFIGRNNRLRQ